MSDTTDVRVRVILSEGFLDAHPGAGVRAESLEPVCISCGHGLSAHHGPNGELHCGEVCGCPAFTERALDDIRGIGIPDPSDFPDPMLEP